MAERTIILKGERLHIRKELEAGGAVTPGHLVMLASSGKGVVHNAAKARAQRMFAIERELEDHESGGSPVVGAPIDIAYASGDRLLLAVCSAGCEVYALLAAGATAVTKGALLESAGDGTLRVLTADNTTGPVFGGYPIAVALEAVDNSGGANPARIIVETL